MLAATSPVDHVYVLAPLAVMVVEVPGQTLVDEVPVVEMVGVGFIFKVISNVPIALHDELFAVTVYIVLLLGVAVTVCEVALVLTVVTDGFQVYVFAPLAIIVAVFPLQIAVSPLNLTKG